MKLINQPFNGQLGNHLIELLDSHDYQTLNIVVAFAKNSGVLRIKDSLKKFRDGGGIVNIYVGVDLGGTSYEALTDLLLHADSLNVVHAKNGQTFHSKIYQFLGQDKGLVVVGSHNLTAGGLWTNFESSIIVPVDKSTNNNTQILDNLNDYFNNLDSLKDSIMKISSQDDIDKLLEHGYVSKEDTGQVNRAKTVTQNGNQESLFGNGVTANLPHVTSTKKEKPKVTHTAPAESIPISLDDKEQAIWFETRKMTGGSRNILDLSMKSLVEHGDPNFISGGVEFFGVNPIATKKVKKITINFEGIDYSDNAILFNVANGTWRLQIKGVSDSKEKITEAFRTKGVKYYLVEKIITFTKIKDDYYSMSVFPESELDNFKAASHILAHNGSTQSTKYLGLIFRSD